MLNNDCNGFLFGVHCVEEGDHIPPLQSYGQVLKQKDCFSGVLGDDYGASANLLDYLNSHVISCACCFYGNGVEHGVIIIIVVIFITGVVCITHFVGGLSGGGTGRRSDATGRGSLSGGGLA